METRLFEEGTVPEWTTPEWYAERETAPHLEQEGHRERLILSAQMAVAAVDAGATRVVDLGSGDGGLLQLVTQARTIPVVGYDLQQSNVEAAVTRLGSIGVVQLRNVVADPPPIPDGACVVVTEMLEHLLDPFAMVEWIGSTGAAFVVASSPYTETIDSHYGFHTWCWDLVGYRRLFENRGWNVLQHDTAWISQVLLVSR